MVHTEQMYIKDQTFLARIHMQGFNISNNTWRTTKVVNAFDNLRCYLGLHERIHNMEEQRRTLRSSINYPYFGDSLALSGVGSSGLAGYLTTW